MRDFSRSTTIGTCAALVAGFIVMTASPALSASAAPGTGFPSLAGVEIRNDSAATQEQAAIPEPAEIDASIVACASTPPMPVQASAQAGPGATSLGAAGGGRIAD